MIIQTLRNGIRKFTRNEDGGTAISFALAVVPVMATVGAAVDLGRGVVTSNNMQNGLDQAVLTVVNTPGTDAERKLRADAIFAASFHDGAATTTLVTNTDGTVTYSARMDMTTMFVPFVSSSIAIGRSATAKATAAGTAGVAGVAGVVALRDDSCILSLGEDLDVNFDAMVFNGNPSVTLTNCSLISNKSMKCNGNNVGAAASYAHGSVTGCPNPHPGTESYPDIYAPLVSNITRICGTTKTGYAWATSGSAPGANGTTVQTVAQTGYREIHICGTLTLSGVSSLTGNTPSEDTVIIIENGALNLANGANVKAYRTTFVLAGNNSGVLGDAAIVTWPSGAGKSATLRMTSSTGFGATSATTTSNPWKGQAIYQNPNINLDQDWKPGANLFVDGIVYFSKAKLTVGGNISYGAGNCSKLVSGEFTLNGNVALKQDAESCGTLGVVHYYRAPVEAVAAVEATAAASSYLMR